MKLQKLLTLSFLMLLVSTTSVFAQQFSIPLEGFSRKKTAYLHMEDGTKLEGTLAGFKRSKGLIEAVKMKDANGEKLKIDPATISYMYLASSNLARLGAAMEAVGSIRNWEKETNMDTTLMNDGYVYFEKSSTKIKKKTNDLMLQLMNASFSSKIKVYHDPFASESMALSIGDITVAGGLDKSYYIKKSDDELAIRLFKRDYKEMFITLFGDCPEVMDAYGDNIKWSELETHIYEYTQHMK
jgi:hypothetical protein